MSVSQASKGAVLSADRALRGTAALWVSVAAVGLWIFAGYILALYGVGLARGDLGRWNTVLPKGHGYVAGDLSGNLALGVHLAMALVVTLSGAPQLVPAIRTRAPQVHRWTGRLFISVALVAAATGLFIAFSRGAVAGLYMTAGNVLDAALILTFGALAWRRAVAHRIDAHRRWALRLFVVVNAVWFYRLGMMLWFGINRAPVGHTDAFDGPFDVFLAFGHVLAPLAMVELYLLTRDRAGAAGKLAMAALLAGLTLATAAGILLVALGLWLPNL